MFNDTDRVLLFFVWTAKYTNAYMVSSVEEEIAVPM